MRPQFRNCATSVMFHKSLQRLICNKTLTFKQNGQRRKQSTMSLKHVTEVHRVVWAS